MLTENGASVNSAGRFPIAGGGRGLPVGGQPDTGNGWPRSVTRGHLCQHTGEVAPRLAESGIVDWLAFTVPCKEEQTPEELAIEVGAWLPPATSPLERGMMGYTQGAHLPGEGRILWNNDRPDMGVHVEMPSKCLRLLAASVVEFCGRIKLAGGKATRIDVALDSDKVHMSQVVGAQSAGNLISRAQDRRLIYNYRDGSQTLYVGSPSSRRLVRFYDKALEQQSKGEAYEGIWTRCEVQFRREQADLVCEYIALEIALVDIVNSTVDFRNRASDSMHPNRCPQLEWWAAWVGKAEKISFAMGQVVADVVAEAYKWVERQVAPTIAFLERALGRWLLEEMVDKAAGRIPQYRLNILSTMGA